MRFSLILLHLLIVSYRIAGQGDKSKTGTESKAKKKYEERLPAAKYDNPNYVRDRNKSGLYKPQMDLDYANRFKKPYHPAWQDYCDPYHCNDYHRTVCGLNRVSLRFKWFQSGCHLILNNQCATYRGALKYDLVANKYCGVYVMYLRNSCKDCDDDDDEEAICAVSTVTSDVVLFRNRCTMEKANCEKGKTEYEEVKKFLCAFYLNSLV